MKVLIADDEKSIVATLEDDLADAGHTVFVAPDGLRALDIVKRETIDCLISDLNMPGLGGMALLEESKKINPAIQAIMITGFGTIESAVSAMKLGAADYVLKPFRNAQIVAILDRIQKILELERQNQALQEQIDDICGLDNIVGQSKKMLDVFRTIRTVAKSDSNILITGETGTGKEVIARAIHNHSLRRGKPLVALSCAAVPMTLLEDELFGHERGAFTDARERKIGRVERAQGGSFFLDDIDDMPLETQVKLLRVLQERELERLGGEKTIKVDVRIIAATKVDLREHVRAGKFREDLFYRLNVVPIPLPPLRDRHGDIRLLAQHFVRKFGGAKAYEIKEETAAAMDAYYWPGNVRELEHAIERAIAFAGSGLVLRKEHLVEQSADHKKALAVPERNVRKLKEFIEDQEREYLADVLKLTHGHKAQAASLLGISRKNLWEKLRLYGMDPE